MSAADDSVLAVAIQAARSAAAVITDAARDLVRLPTFSKDHGDIVSTADVEAEDAIVATLRTAFPGHAILGEESGHIAGAREGTGHKWIVDPIDGTVNFIHGFPYYAVSIALVHGTEVTHAVVYDPVHDDCFTAIKGKGAFRNGASLRVSDVHRPGPGAGRYRVSHARKARNLRPTCPRSTTWSASAPDCGAPVPARWTWRNLAAGRLDGFWVTSLKSWDVAAGALLVREAGGRVGDFAGGADFLRSDEVIAAAPGLFNSLREAITYKGSPQPPIQESANPG